MQQVRNCVKKPHFMTDLTDLYNFFVIYIYLNLNEPRLEYAQVLFCPFLSTPTLIQAHYYHFSI